MNNAQAQNQTRKRKRISRLILFILIIMLLLISQVLVLLGSSSSISQLPEPVSVTEQQITLDDLLEVKTEFNEVVIRLNEIINNPDLVEVKKLESNQIVAPLPNDFVENDHVETKKVENIPVAVPAAPVLVKPVVLINNKNITKPKKKNSQNKKVVPVINSPAIVIPVSVNNNGKAIQSIEKTVDEETVVADMNPKTAYIKLDINGKILDDSNEQWACVQDTKTGLMWEVKSKDDSIRNSNNLYSWFDPEDKILQGVTDGGRCKGGTDCDTNAYMEAMNQQKFCGHNDWRLPTDEEMLGLVNFESGPDNVKIDTSYFPHTLPSWYWTASSNKSRPEFAWYVLFKNGMPLNDLKENPKHIRLVRNESSS